MSDRQDKAGQFETTGNGFGPDELALLNRWAEDMDALGDPAAAKRLRWRAYCAFTGGSPDRDPGSDVLFIALENVPYL